VVPYLFGFNVDLLQLTDLLLICNLSRIVRLVKLVAVVEVGFLYSGCLLALVLDRSVELVSLGILLDLTHTVGCRLAVVLIRETPDVGVQAVTRSRSLSQEVLMLGHIDFQIVLNYQLLVEVDQRG